MKTDQLSRAEATRRAHRAAAYTVAALSAGVCPQDLSLTHIGEAGSWEPWVSSCLCHQFGDADSDWWVVSSLAEQVVGGKPEKCGHGPRYASIELDGLDHIERLILDAPSVGEPFHDVRNWFFPDMEVSEADAERARAQFQDLWCKAIEIVRSNHARVDDLANQLFGRKRLTAEFVLHWWNGMREAA